MTLFDSLTALGVYQLLGGKLLLTLARTITPGSDSHGTQDFILLSDGSGTLQNPSPCHLHEPEKVFGMGGKTEK
jgi:hypothetical protein